MLILCVSQCHCYGSWVSWKSWRSMSKLVQIQKKRLSCSSMHKLYLIKCWAASTTNWTHPAPWNSFLFHYLIPINNHHENITTTLVYYIKGNFTLGHNLMPIRKGYVKGKVRLGTSITLSPATMTTLSCYLEAKVRLSHNVMPSSHDNLSMLSESKG
jgi:hypothetical protein